MKKFHGFYRLRKESPSPVIPIFRENGLFFVQKSIDGAQLDGFSQVNDLDPNRLFVSDEHNIIAPKEGEKLIYSYEYAKKNVAIGSHENILPRVYKHLSSQREDVNVFAKFEIALERNNDLEIKESALRCFCSLQLISSELSRKWLDGSDIPPETKQWVIRSNATQTVNITAKRLIQTRIVCPKIVIDTIDEFAQSNKMARNIWLNACIDAMQGDFPVGDFRSFYSTYCEKILRPSEHAKIEFQITNRVEASWGSNYPEKALRTFVVNDWPEFSGTLMKRPSVSLSLQNIRKMNDDLRNCRLGRNERSKGAYLLFCCSFKERDLFSMNEAIGERASAANYPDSAFKWRLRQFMEIFGSLVV